MAGARWRQAAGGLLLLLAVAGVLSACSQETSPPLLERGGVESLVRVDGGQGGVTVQATWVTPTHLEDMSKDVVRGYPVERYVLIHLKLDTHSVDLLKYDLPGLAALQRPDGAVFAPAAWLAVEESGHHREGVLAFPGGSPEQWTAGGGAALLTLRGIADVPERVFAWEFPSSGE